MVVAVQNNYLDISALNKIKVQSKTDSKSALKSVAAEFETIFLKMMLKSMRDASFGDPMLDSETAKIYRDMYDDQLAMDLSKSGGVGLADVLVKQLEKFLPEGETSNNKGIASGEIEKATNSLEKNNSSSQLEVEPVIETAPAIKNPEDFVKYLMPHAEKAAEQIGVKPKVLLAQAALETGWGQYVIQQDNGKSSHNLFNIKSDKRWQGKDTSISTVEYFGNKPQTRQASFRVYNSYEESFQDYVNFLQDSPRYRHALDNTDNAEAFTRSLQKSGYATDPLYANKIIRILNDKPMNDALSRLNTSM